MSSAIFKAKAAPVLAGAALVVCAGLAAAVWLFPRDVHVDGQADWRAVSQGLRRSGEAARLAATPDAIVHFHDVRGGIRDVTLRLSARSPAMLELVRGDGARREVPLAATPADVVVEPATNGASDIDVRLSTGDGDARVLVHEIRLRRGEAGGMWRLAPLACGLLAFVLLVRSGEPTWWSAVMASGSTVIAAAALVAAMDPLAALPLRPGTRALAQGVGLAALFAIGVARGSSRAVAALALAGGVAILYAPTIRYGLVYDDFLWTRPWTLREVASTFVGSEDPTGVSNSYYRPWASLSHAVDYRLWGFRPPLFHATNLVLITCAAGAAYALFRRLALARGAALAGALAWIAHPMSGSAVAWMSQRTDVILALLYLLSLGALLARPFTRGRAAAALALGALTLGAKELAVTLPIAAALLLWAWPPDEDHARRWQVVRGLGLLVLAYVPLWIAMFPEKLVTRTGAASGWGAFDPGHPTDWLRLLPALYGPLVLPTGYASWWRTPLQDWSAAYLAGVALVTAALVAFVSRDPDRHVRRLGVLGAGWPLVLMVPLLGLRGVDLYRGCLLYTSPSPRD